MRKRTILVCQKGKWEKKWKQRSSLGTAQALHSLTAYFSEALGHPCLYTHSPDISGIIRGILWMNMWAITMMWSQKSQSTRHQQPGRLTQIMPWPAKGFYACKEWDYVKGMRFQSLAEALFAHFHWKAGGGKCLGKQYECCCCRESMGNSDKYLIKLVSNIITIKSNLFNFLYAWLSLHTQKDVNWQPSF